MMTQMHILVIHQYFLGDNEAGGSRFNELTRFWREAGHRVTVIAGQVSYTTGYKPEPYRGKWLVREGTPGIEVLRAYTPDTYGKGIIGRMKVFFAFMFSAAIAGMARIDRPDVVIATSPPLVTAVAGYLAAWRWRAPLVFEVRDLWPESAVAVGVLKANSLLTRALYALERFIYKVSARIVVLTPAFRDNIVGRGLAPEERIAFIPNGADLDQFSPGPRDEALRARLEWGNRFVALYAGAHGLANHLDQLVDAAECLKAREDILIVTAGDGPERPRLLAEIERRGLSNIKLMGQFPKTQMPDLVRSCDAGLAVLKRIDTFKTVYPNKVFDYMACAKPVVLGIDGVARSLVVDQAQAGLFAEPEDAPAIASALTRLADDYALRDELGENGRSFVVTNFSREALAAQYLRLIETLAKH